MARQEDVDEARADDGLVDDAGRVRHADDEIRALGPQALGLAGQGFDLGMEAQVAGLRLLRRARQRDADEADYAIAFAIPINTPGLKILCRDLYAEHADPERHPLTTRFDEVDAALIFEDVVVPWERVFVYKNPQLLAGIEDDRPSGHNDDRMALVLIALALALFLFGALQGDPDDLRNMGGAALFPGFVGIALLVRYYLAKKRDGRS